MPLDDINLYTHRWICSTTLCSSSACSSASATTFTFAIIEEMEFNLVRSSGLAPSVWAAWLSKSCSSHSLAYAWYAKMSSEGFQRTVLMFLSVERTSEMLPSRSLMVSDAWRSPPSSLCSCGWRRCTTGYNISVTVLSVWTHRSVVASPPHVPARKDSWDWGPKPCRPCLLHLPAAQTSTWETTLRPSESLQTALTSSEGLPQSPSWSCSTLSPRRDPQFNLVSFDLIIVAYWRHSQALFAWLLNLVKDNKTVFFVYKPVNMVILAIK